MEQPEIEVRDSGNYYHQNLRRMGFKEKSRRYNGEGNGIPLQYSCLENPVDGGAW